MLDDTWVPGTPCASCGSTHTYLEDGFIPACASCHRADADEGPFGT